jgi:hypothetical protein
MMKFVKIGAVLGAVTIALAANDALAEQCNGYVVSKPLPTILLRDAPDGSKVKWFSSEGIFIVDNPKDHPANRLNRVCGGGFKIAPDGKSGLGVGSCTYTDFAGDVFHLSWQSTFIEGTWTIIGGSGKFEKFSGQGTFKPTKKFENFWGSTTWEGECSLS